MQAYRKQCAKLLEVMGTVALRLGDTDEAIRSVVDAVCALGHTLCGAHSVSWFLNMSCDDEFKFHDLGRFLSWLRC